VLAAYTFGDVMWTMLVFFAWIIFFWLLFIVFGDLFSRHDIGGWAKAGWCIFVIIIPFLGIFIYLIANGHGMSERAAACAGPAGADGQLRPLGRIERFRRGSDRPGEATARLRRDHAGRVRPAQGEGARLAGGSNRKRCRPVHRESSPGRGLRLRR